MPSPRISSTTSRKLDDSAADRDFSPSQGDLFLAIEHADHDTLNQLKAHLEAELKSRQERAYEENYSAILELFGRLNQSDRSRMLTTVVQEALDPALLPELALNLLDQLPAERTGAFLAELANRKKLEFPASPAAVSADPEAEPEADEAEEEESDEAEEKSSKKPSRRKRAARGIVGIYFNRENPAQFKKSPRTPNDLKSIPADQWQYLKIEDMSPYQRDLYGF